MRIAKEKLALAAQSEIEESIRRAPHKWAREIAENVDEPAILLEAIIKEYAALGITGRLMINPHIELYAQQAGASVYEGIFSCYDGID